MGPLVLTEVLFDEKIREQIRKYRRHFLRVSHLFCTHCDNCSELFVAVAWYYGQEFLSFCSVLLLNPSLGRGNCWEG